jgi:hypothetical protein
MNMRRRPFKMVAFISDSVRLIADNSTAERGDEKQPERKFMSTELRVSGGLCLASRIG